MPKGTAISISVSIGTVLAVVGAMLALLFVDVSDKNDVSDGFSANVFFDEAASLDYGAMSVSLDEFLILRKQENVVVVDVRSLASYEHGHIDGAVHLAGTDITKPRLEELVPDADTTLLLYCDYSLMPIRMISLMHMSAPQFVKLGYKNVRTLSPVYEAGDTIGNYKDVLPWTGE